MAELYGDLHRHASNSFADEYLLPGFHQHLSELGLDPEVALRGKSFLDAGCGGFAGGVTIALALGASPIVGVDLSADNVAEARRRVGDASDIHLRQENLLSLTMDSDTFDFVYCNGVLHHTEAPERAFRELVRVLKPGGRIYIGIYGRGGLFNEMVVPAMKLAGRLVPRRATACLVALTPWLRRPSSSLMDFMYVPIEVHFRRAEIERWFTIVGMDPVFLRHYYQPDSIWNRLLFGEGTMLFFSGVKGPG